MQSLATLERALKIERVHARVRPDEKVLLERASYAAGLSLSRFMLTAALKEARKTMRDNMTILTPERAAAFGEALLHPPAPSKTAVASFKKARRWPSK